MDFILRLEKLFPGGDLDFTLTHNSWGYYIGYTIYRKRFKLNIRLCYSATQFGSSMTGQRGSWTINWKIWGQNRCRNKYLSKRLKMFQNRLWPRNPKFEIVTLSIFQKTVFTDWSKKELIDILYIVYMFKYMIDKV